MKSEKIPPQFAYDPNGLLDELIVKFELRNDGQLAELLGLSPPNLSKLRHFRIPVGAAFLVRVHDVTQWSIKDIRAAMGDHRNRFQFPARKRRLPGKNSVPIEVAAPRAASRR